MKLLELFYKRNNLPLIEGGNLSTQSPGWQGDTGDHQAQQIDLKVHKRSYIVPILDKLLNGINSSFTASVGHELWNKKVLASKKFLSGSSLHFFNTDLPDDEFERIKPKVGDIDTQINKEYAGELVQFLQSSTGKVVGNGKLIGFSKGNEQYSTMWELTDPPIKVQIDLEFVDYEKDEPTDWAGFSHSSSWEDLSQGIKGVFHKYLIQSFTRLTSQDFLLRKMVGRGKARVEQDVPTTDNMFSFAVSSKEGGGLRPKYEPVLDDAGQPLEIDGLPVMRALPASGYEKNIGKIFQNIFGKRVKETEIQKLLPKTWSFTGLLEIMNLVVPQDEKEKVIDAFIDKLYAPGAQGLYKGDPERDILEKNTALNYALKTLNVTPHKNLEQMRQDYKASYKVSESINEAEVVQSKRKGIVHLEKMKDSDFLNLLDELKNSATGKFELHNVPMTVKVDGFGARFGKDKSGKPYMETSRSGPKFEPGTFSKHAEERQAAPDVKARAKLFDDLYDEMMHVIANVDQKLGNTALNDVKIHCEVLYLPFATETEDGKLKFVGIHYDKLPEGVTLALVPLFAEKSSTGEQHPNSDKYISALRKIGRIGTTMFIDNSLTTNGSLDVTGALPPIENLETLRSLVNSGKRDLKKEATEALQPVKEYLAKFIIQHPDIIGKDKLGKDYEGIILNTKNGPVKITSQEQKDIISAKNAAIKSARPPGATGDGRSGKTAVVTAGSFVGHIGHQQLVDFVLNKASQLNADPYVYISSAVGPDDPIPASVKLQTWQKLYPEKKAMFQLIQEGGLVMKKIEKELVTSSNPPPYDHIIVMVGEDRYEGFKKWMEHLSKRMKNPKYPGFEHVKFDVEVTPRAAETGGTGMSFTKLRNILKDPNATPEQQFALWSQGFDVQKLGKDWIMKLMDFTRKGMGIQESISEAPIEMDPSEPMNPMIHSHDKANPAKLKYRMMRAAGQIKDLASRVDNASPYEWQNMAKQFDELKMNVEQIRHALEELAKVRRKGGIRSRGIDPMIDSVEEGWKSKTAGAALAAANLLASPAQAAEEPVKPITIAYVMIDGEMRKYNLGDKFSSAKEAEEFISKVLDKQGLQGYQLEIKHGYPKKKEVKEGYGRYWCSTDKKWKTRKGPKQKRSS